MAKGRIDSGKLSQGTTPNRFAKHPVRTLILFIAAGLVVIDLIAGLLFIPKDYHAFRCTHPFYHHDFIPSATAETMWGGREYEVLTNSLGFRDGSTRTVTSDYQGKRYLFMGDSFLEGMGVSWEESVAGILNSRFSEKGTEILNGAAVSYSPLLYWLKTRYLIEEKGLNFDELFVFIDISDIQDEIFYKGFEPRLPTAWNHLIMKTGRFLARTSFLGYSISAVSHKHPRIDNAFYEDEMANINVWFQNLDGYMDSDNPEEGRFIWTLDNQVFKRWGKEGLRLAGKHMKQLKDLCDKHGIPQTIVVYPAPHQIFANDLDSRQVTFWKEFSEKYGTGFLNLFPVFIGERTAEETYGMFFIKGDTHWNPDGNLLVAEMVERFIEGGR
ncbi:MAG: hypothetical protein JW861_09780 [Bacteroidales bacterium]|nr:hypothetical protein [Bacteroidales bacterium]